MATLAVWSPHDAVLGAAAPLALASARPTTLVIDLDPVGPHYPGTATLRDFVENGPRRADLEPQQKGLAVLRNGGVSIEGARTIVEALSLRWPDVVYRYPPGTESAARLAAALPDTKVVPVIPLLPGGLLQHPRVPAVYQPAGWPVETPQPGYRLPRLSPRTVGSLLSGVQPVPDRWMRAWATVWRLPWV